MTSKPNLILLVTTVFGKLRTSPHGTKALNYRSEIDGLRAVAVLPVILFHAGFEVFSGGYVGVDIFFVISGFLIGTIIMTELDRDKFSILTFYERRARRILPALFFVILTTYLFAWVWLPSGFMREFSQSMVSVAVFLSNIFFWSNSGYFDTASELQLLLHTWSLAVEEQFYVLFPLYLMACWKFGRTFIFYSLLCALIISLCVAEYIIRDYQNTAFYLLPTRVWELTIGVLAALYCLNQEAKAKNNIDETFSFLGLAAITYSIFAFNADTSVPGITALVPTVGAVLIIVFAKTGTLVHRLLSIKIVVGVGLISYSLYLWHQPVLALARHRLLGDITQIVPYLLVLIFIAAIFSWYFVEKPFRSKRFERKTIFQLSAVGMIALIAVGLTGHLIKGFPQREIAYLSFLADIELGSYEYNNRKLREESWEMLRDQAAERSLSIADSAVNDAEWFDVNDERQKMLVVGNSHSKDLYNIFSYSSAADEYQFGRFGIEISDITDEFFNHPNVLASDVVFIASRYAKGDLDAIESVVDKLISIDKEVFLATRMFEFPNSPPYNLADTMVIKHAAKNIENDSLVEAVNAEYTRVFEEESSKQRMYVLARENFDQIKNKHASVKVLDRMKYICPPGQGCLAMGSDYSKYFYDYGHHTKRGAEVFAEVMDNLGLDNILQ